MKRYKKKELKTAKKKGNQQFTMEGRNAEITVDLVLQARAKTSDNKVNGPEDAVVSEVLPRTFPGSDGLSLWKIV